MSILVQGARVGSGATARARRVAPRLQGASATRFTRAWTRAIQNGATQAQASEAGLRAAGSRGRATQNLINNDTFNQARNAFRGAIRQGQSRQQARRAAQRIMPGVSMADLNGPRR